VSPLPGERPRSAGTKRESELQARVDELAEALGEAYVELRAWRKGGLSTHVHQRLAMGAAHAAPIDAGVLPSSMSTPPAPVPR
jgi:hypothetical protein